MPQRRLELGPEDRAFLVGVARDTWRYFETFMGPDDHGLPADNFQETPEPRVAHRTSPTNIGMGLLATLAAHDLGFIAADVLARRIDATLTTMEGLERHEGHLLNWYDTRSLAPLAPRYVSTVDSGNLAGALMTLAEGLREAGLIDLALPGLGLRGGNRLRLPLRPAAPDPLDRLSARGRRGAGSPGLLVLRPPGFGGAARELHRHRTRRAARDALVPPGPAGHERRTARRRCCRGAARPSST